MKGMTPMPMMDRDKQNELPQLEVSIPPLPDPQLTTRITHFLILLLLTLSFVPSFFGLLLDLLSFASCGKNGKL